MDKKFEEEKFKWPRLWSPSKFSPSPAPQLPEHKYKIPDTAPKGIFQIFAEENPFKTSVIVLGSLGLIIQFWRKY
uniref:Uncharacterized protein n=1 Tax=Meloidogyne enterolobii TaxID=390850 RepID=A0A6V7TLX3_MELEN|nr:unnamed protein product [Meloidogyne enterolobii]